jgi:hypothetical protein
MVGCAGELWTVHNDFPPSGQKTGTAEKIRPIIPKCRRHGKFILGSALMMGRVQRDELSRRASRFRFGGRRGFDSRMRSGGFVIDVAAAVAGVVTGRSVGRGRNTVGAAIAHATIHALTAFLAPAVFAVIVQYGSLENDACL